jgi:hypothetical protein
MFIFVNQSIINQHLLYTNTVAGSVAALQFSKTQPLWAPVAHDFNSNTQEAEIRRIMVQGQSRQRVCKTPISKIIREKWTGYVLKQ